MSSPERKLIVVTGAGSGIGLGSATALKDKGYVILAVCQFEEEVVARKNSGMEAIQGDLTDNSDVEKVVACAEELLEQKNLHLWAVVNSAGRIIPGMCDWLSLQNYEDTFRINFFALVNLTNKLIPLLKNCPGSRVVNISSIEGFISAPGNAPYNASKYAVEAFSNTLRAEMRWFNVHVSVVEPGIIKTKLAAGVADGFYHSYTQADVSVQAEYGEDFGKQFLESNMINLADDVSVAVKDIVKACTRKKPKCRYISGFSAKWILKPISRLPSRWQDYILTKMFFKVKPAVLNAAGPAPLLAIPPAENQETL